MVEAIHKLIPLRIHITVVTIVLRVPPSCAVIGCCISKQSSHLIDLCANSVQLIVVEYVPYFLQTILKLWPCSQLTNPVLRKLGLIVDPCVPSAHVSIAEVPDWTEEPLLLLAVAVTVFVKITTAVVTLAVFQQFLNEVILYRLVQIQQTP